MRQHKTVERDALTDEQIITLYNSRNETAIDETHRKYGKLLLSVAHQILQDQQDSEECRNDTYLKAWNSIPPTQPTSLQAYLAQIVRAIAINRYTEKRKKSRIPSQLTESLEELAFCLSDFSAVEQEANAAELGRYINDYVSTLSPRQQYVFISRYYFAKPVEDIAKMLQITRFGVYKHIDEIKKGLRAYLAERGEMV